MKAANAGRASDRQGADRRWGAGAQPPGGKAFAEKRKANWQNR